MSNDFPNRHTIRLTGYDYSESGWYFITVCTQNRECILGNIIDGKMVLNDVGKMIESVWLSLLNRFPIVLDAFQIMPNHVHMIINNVGAILVVARDEYVPARTTIGDIIGAFKSLINHEYIVNVKNNNWKHFNKRLLQRNPACRQAGITNISFVTKPNTPKSANILPKTPLHFSLDQTKLDRLFSID